MKVTIIGAGNMGGAIARGMATGSIVKAEEITVTAKTQATLDKLKADIPAINVCLNNREAAEGASIIMLCVKPWLIQPVIEEIYPAINQSNPLIISVAAGITFEQFQQMMGGDNRPIARVIPNTAIAIKESPTLMCFNEAMNEAQKQLVEAIFNELGSSIVTDEGHMAAGTAITSCGIAYAFAYIRAAIQAGIELGFYPHVAKSMVDQTVLGAVKLLEHNGSMPDAEIYKVCTPGGITIRGLNEMTKEGFDHAVIAGLKKAAGKQ